MSDITSLNVSELDDLQRRLVSVKLAPSAREREQLIYSCGQAAGRAAAGRHLRRMYVIAASLTCLSAGLSVVLLTGGAGRSSSPIPVQPSITETAGVDSSGGTLLPGRERSEEDRSDQQSLTAGTSYDRMLTLDRATAAEFAQNNALRPTSLPVLTPLGHPQLDEL